MKLLSRIKTYILIKFFKRKYYYTVDTGIEDYSLSMLWEEKKDGSRKILEVNYK